MRLVLIGFLILLLASCKEDKNTSTTIPSNNEEQVMKDLIKQYPDSFSLIQNLTSYYLSKQNFDGAISLLDNTIKKDTANPFLWDMQAIVYAEKGDTSKAIKCFENAIDIFPKPEFIISLGSLFAQSQNPKALEIADALIQGNKAKAEKEAYFIKGLYYSLHNEKEKAIPFFDKSIAISYTFMDPYMEKGVALMSLNKIKEATDVFEKAVTIQNNYAEGYYQLGRCYEKLNRQQDAIDAYNTALIRDPSYIEAKEAMGRLGVR